MSRRYEPGLLSDIAPRREWPSPWIVVGVLLASVAGWGLIAAAVVRWA